MLLYAWMLFVETAPERYDAGMRVMTLGRLDKIKDAVAEAIRPGDNMLDIGCGTGTLAVRCMRKGATVTGIDSSAFMLEQAQKNAAAAGLGDRFQPVKDSATQLKKHFADASFDAVVSTAALGEFPKSYLEYIFQECNRILKPGGRLFIGDELQPENLLSRTLYNVLMGVLWIPQFLIVRRVAYPIKGLPAILESSGFRVDERRGFWPSKLELVFATKR